MGQRLNLEIRANGKPLANCYMHWSAYTLSAGEIVKDILNSNHIFDEPTVETAIILIQEGSPAAGIGITDIEEAKKILPLQLCVPAVDRNEGIIAITESGMDQNRDWAEGTVVIDIVKHEINFDVWFEFDDEDDWGAEKPIKYCWTTSKMDCMALAYDEFSEFVHAVKEFLDKSQQQDFIPVYVFSDGSKYLPIY